MVSKVIGINLTKFKNSSKKIRYVVKLSGAIVVAPMRVTIKFI
jgi:hypothetical protein